MRRSREMNDVGKRPRSSLSLTPLRPSSRAIDHSPDVIVTSLCRRHVRLTGTRPHTASARVHRSIPISMDVKDEYLWSGPVNQCFVVMLIPLLHPTSIFASFIETCAL